MEYLILILFIIIILVLIISKYKLLNIDCNQRNDNNFIINDEYSYLLKKFSSINYDIDYNYNDLLNKNTILINNVIETSLIDDEKIIIELIANDINKTKINNNDFKKINNIYIVIKKINDNINESLKIIIFYEGNINIFNENDFSNKYLVYKLNLNDKIFNHYLQ